MGKQFVFEFEQEVRIVISGETGIIIGRAEYMAAEDGYLIRYKASDGRAVEAWWGGSALDVA